MATAAQLKQQYLDAQKQAIDYNASASTFGDELQKAINQNDAAYKPFENDVNSLRNSYYNTTGSLLPTITAKQQYSNDPMLALQALENERTIGGTRYQNADDALKRRRGTLSELVNSYTNTANATAQKQNSLASLLAEQYNIAAQEEERAAQRRLASLMASGGGTGAGANGYNPSSDKAYQSNGKHGELRKGQDGIDRVWDDKQQAWVSTDAFSKANTPTQQTPNYLSFDPASEALGDLFKGIGNYTSITNSEINKNATNWWDRLNPAIQFNAVKKGLFG